MKIQIGKELTLKETPIIHFKNPPLNEVVIGVQFVGLNWQIQHYGSFYDLVKNDFQLTHAVPPLAQPFEQAGFKLMSGAELPRAWYEEKDGPFLLQIQPDRFLLNWRKKDSSNYEYPHFQEFFERFKKEFQRFKEFCTRSSIGNPRIETYELTYINHIVSGSQGISVLELSSLFNHLSFLSEFKTSKIFGMDLVYTAENYQIKHTVKKGIRNTDRKEIFILDFSIADVLKDPLKLEDTLSNANKALVSQFAKLASNEAKLKWGESK